MLLIDAERQRRFAALAGDYNPLHVDSQQARRSQFGAPVVHGIHLLLAGINSLEVDRPCRIVQLNAQFRNAVLVGETIRIRSEETRSGAYHIEIGVRNQTRATIDVSLEVVDDIAEGLTVEAAPRWATEVATFERIDAVIGASGAEQLAVDTDLLNALFPSIQRCVITTHVAALLAVTRVVGMKCPGQWALFRRLSWQAARNEVAVDRLNWSVAEVNQRYAMTRVAFDIAGVQAVAEVILRAPPPRQASLDRVRADVSAGEFAQARVLVVGGSRGLGELAAKLMAVGGATVLITYSTGEADAKRIADEIGNSADVLQLAAESPSVLAVERVARFAPTHVLYFATPAITRSPTDEFDDEVFQRLKDVYATGFEKVLRLAQSGGSLRSVFFPSSIYVDERPSGFAEYVAAKQAGEAVGSSWRDTHGEQCVVIDRLPPLVTDQTAAKLGPDTDRNVSVLLTALRKMEQCRHE